MPETDTNTTPAPAQASAQVLDVGDVVRVLDTSDGLRGREGVLIRVVDERHVVAIPGIGQIGGYERSDLERVGGDLQPGDWVRVTGQCETTKTTDPETLDRAVGVILERTGESIRSDFIVAVYSHNDLYECRADQLTRITRAEALA